MKIAQITELLEEFAPVELAMEGDRIGMMVGDRDAECDTVCVALDLTPSVLKDAIDGGAQLIVTHHPFIWDPLARVLTGEKDGKGNVIATLIKRGIAVYSMHTNLDMAPKGLNMTLAARLGGTPERDEFGVVFRADRTLKKLAEDVAEEIGDRSVRFVGDPEATVRKAYLVTGSGGCAFDRAAEVADCLITGELKHHQYLDALERGLMLVEFSHYHSEIIMQDILPDALAGTGLKIIKAAQSCPFWRI